MPSKHKISVIVPIFNEYENIKELISRLEVIKGEFSDFEVLMIDDGSNDGSLELIQNYQINFPWLKVISLSRNFGHQVAVMAGLRSFQGTAVAIIDGDLQDPPELIPRMVEVLDEGNEIVFGERVAREGESQFKLLSSKLFYVILNKLSDIWIPPNVGDFRVVTAKAARLVASFEEPFPFVRGLFAYTGLRAQPYPYRRDKRHAGDSKYPFRKMVRLAGHALFSFSESPIRLAFRATATLSLVSVLGIFMTVMNLLNERPVPGWLSLMALISIFGAVNLFFLAIIMKYAELILRSVRNRPLYVKS